uniref:Metastasis associated 1 n=1 Tax=Oreochromis niloticus TaxID=8128 RepID=A0A669BA91_ORENI
MGGDYVYFENSSSNPLLIRRIEELNKTANGNVEAKVVCFYRRRDISSTLIALADKHARELEEEMENPEMRDLPEKQKHQLRHRELFLSRQLESLPATHIRGKCCVTLLNETEALKSYLDREDAFFYSLVYDPQQKTLLADKGEIRVGNKYQADITDLLKEGEDDGRDLEKMEEKIWDSNSSLTEKQIDQFLVVARSVGTFARALDCSSSVRQPSLHMSAAAASRDITLFHAMDTLHATGYDMTRAIAALVPQGGPVLCRDEMEEWSASEANLFEEALEKYGKDFTDIQQDFLPWKSLTSIIEYYYMWKTTDRYVQQKRLKAAEAESKLKQVYIPNYHVILCCVFVCIASSSYQWYSWGPPNMQCRLCASCWTYWKKYGGLKMPTRLDGERPGPNRNNMSPHGLPLRHSGSPKFAVKTRQAFYLQTTSLTRMARRICQDIIRPRYMARHPYLPVNTAAIKAECKGPIPSCLTMTCYNFWALCTLPHISNDSHPRPSKPNPPTRGGSISTGSLTPIKSSPILNNGSPTILGKRTYEQHNGLDGEPDRLETLKHIYNLRVFASSASKNFIFTELLFVTTTIEDYFHLQWYIFGSMSLFLHLSTLPHRYVENQRRGEQQQHQGFCIEQSRLGWGWVAMWLADVQYLWAGRNISAFKSVSLNSAHAQVMLDMLNISSIGFFRLVIFWLLKTCTINMHSNQNPLCGSK